MDYERRTAAVREALTEQGLAALLVGQPANRQYVTGFSWNDESAVASAGWVVLTPSTGYFVTTFLHYAAVEESVLHLEPVKATSSMIDALVELLNQLPPGRIGIEGDWITVNLQDRLTRELGSERELVPVDGLIERLRAVKDADELQTLRRAIDITDRAYVDVLGLLRLGQSEREIAWLVERTLRELGAEGMAFGPSVAAGANAAVPHHEPTDYRVRAGDPIWLDLGARLEGYCGDLTRSFCLESADSEYLRTWDLVLEAERTALAGLRAGRLGKEVDDVARQVFAVANRAEEFGHGLGHGVGLQIHEGPRVVRTSDDVLPVGAVVTIEPGLYRPGWGGVRIEDVALVGPDGAVVLSAAPKQPVVHVRGA